VVVVRRDISFHLVEPQLYSSIDSVMVTGNGELFLGAFADFSFNSVLSVSSWISWRTAGAADETVLTGTHGVRLSAQPVNF